MWIRPTAKLDIYSADWPQKQISQCIRGKYNESWPTWKKIDQRVRDMWYSDDSRAHYKWLPTDDDQIRKAFESRGSKLVKNAMGKIRDDSDDGSWLRPNVLDRLHHYWANDERFQKKSEVGKHNWASDTGAPLYTSGSVSIHEHFDRMTKQKQRHPIAFEV